MKRILLSAIVAVAMTSSALITPAVAARRCPVDLPDTLLSLYRGSDAVFIARFDREELVGVIEETEDYKVSKSEKYFDVSSSLKGETRKLFVLPATEYSYRPQPADSETAANQEAVLFDPYEMDGRPQKLENGDTVILFLRADPESGELSLASERDGVKKVSSDQLPVYVDRMRELDTILNAGTVDPAAIVAWLVQCAVDPATRWEGTFELMQAFNRLESGGLDEEEDLGDAAAAPATGEQAPETDIFNDTSIFAKLLTDDQKTTLANILFDRVTASGDTEIAAPVRGDSELVQLVNRWGDPRMTAYLLEGLKNAAGDRDQNTRAMLTLSAAIADRQAIELAEKYSSIAYEDDNAEVVDMTPEPAGEAVSPEGPKTEDAGEPAAADDQQAAEPEMVKAKLTYKELRQQVLDRFIERVEKVLAKEGNESK